MISSIFPRQKGGRRTPLYSKYLLSNSPGVLGVSHSLSAILRRGDQPGAGCCKGAGTLPSRREEGARPPASSLARSSVGQPAKLGASSG